MFVFPLSPCGIYSNHDIDANKVHNRHGDVQNQFRYPHHYLYLPIRHYYLAGSLPKKRLLAAPALPHSIVEFHNRAGE